MILHGEGKIGARDCAPRIGEFFKRMRRMKVVQDVPVDIDQFAPVDPAADEVLAPYFIEQRFGALHNDPPAHSRTNALM